MEFLIILAVLGGVVFYLYGVFNTVSNTFENKNSFDVLSKKITIFTSENIGKEYVVLGPVSASCDTKTLSELSLMQQADKLGANGIICSHFNVSSNLSGEVSVQKDFFGNNPKIKDTTSIDSTFHLMGSAIKIIEKSEKEIPKTVILTDEVKKMEEDAILEIEKQKKLLDNELITSEEYKERIAVIKQQLTEKKENAKVEMTQFQIEESHKAMMALKFKNFLQARIDEGFEYDEKKKLLSISSSPLDYKIEQNENGECKLVR